MAGGRDEFPGVGLLDDPAQVHHGDPVAHMPHGGEVVGDEDHRQTELLPEPGQQVQDLGLTSRSKPRS